MSPLPIQQAIFDQVVRHAGQMPEKCAMARGNCAYRNEDGTNSCFIGGLLTDDEVKPIIDAGLRTRGVRELLDNRRELLPERLKNWDLRQLLPRLQTIHDVELQEAWPGYLRKLARDFDLATNVVDEVFPRV